MSNLILSYIYAVVTAGNTHYLSNLNLNVLSTERRIDYLISELIVLLGAEEHSVESGSLNTLKTFPIEVGLQNQ